MKYRPNKWLYCICNNNSARTFTPKENCVVKHTTSTTFHVMFFDLVFLFSQHFPCFLFIIKKYCKLLEHLVWFVVSRIRLCILTEVCFKTLRQVITQHNPFTFYFFSITVHVSSRMFDCIMKLYKMMLRWNLQHCCFAFLADGRFFAAMENYNRCQNSTWCVVESVRHGMSVA